MSQYNNIDGSGEISTWVFPPFDETYEEMGETDGFTQGYTEVIFHLPTPIDSSNIELPNYWSDPSSMKTKFSVSRRFKTTVPFIEDSFKLYIGDSECFNYNILAADIFEVNTGELDNYLYVSFMGSTLAAAEDNKITYLRNKYARAQYIGPVIDYNLIIRARRVVNQIETFLNIAPTNWIGGPFNTLLSDSYNIFPDQTPIISEHLIELQNAISILESHIDATIPVVYYKYSFSIIGRTNYFMVSYIEEILEAINLAELVILEYID